jgi:hypothetical protein
MLSGTDGHGAANTSIVASPLSKPRRSGNSSEPEEISDETSTPLRVENDESCTAALITNFDEVAQKEACTSEVGTQLASAPQSPNAVPPTKRRSGTGDHLQD